MPSILYRMYDLNPKNPTTITDGIAIACSDVNAVYPIGSAYTRHAFIVIQDADITVKNAAGNTLQRGTDYFISATAADQRYSKDYNTSIYSGIKFKSTGTYTVTSFISCGTYPRATWFNELWDQLITIRDVTVANLSATVSSLYTAVSDMLTTVSSIAASLSSLTAAFNTHAADAVVHITAAERAAWNNKTNTYFVANITERNALAGLKSGDRVVVWDDGDGKRAVYFYSGSTWYKDDDPDWENVNVAWSALLNIPANVAAVVNSTDVTATKTAGAVAKWDAGGKLSSTTPTDADANQTVATVEYVKSKVSQSGGGNLSTSDTVSVDGEVVVTDGTTGKLHKKSGVLFSTITSAISTLQGYFTGAAANSALRADSRVLSAESDLVVEIYNRLSVGNTIILYGFNLVYAPVASKTIRYDVFYAGSTRWVVKAYDADSFLSYECAIVNGVPPTWTQLTDASGNAVTADNIASSVFEGNVITWAEEFHGGGRILAKNTCTELPAAGWWWIDKHEDSSADCVIRAAAKDSYATAIRRQSNNTWENWVILTDASGNAVNANSLGGIAYATLFDASGKAIGLYRGTTVGQSGTVQQSDVPASVSGWLQLTLAAGTSLHIDGIATLVSTNAVVSRLFPIRTGQTFHISTGSEPYKIYLPLT